MTEHESKAHASPPQKRPFSVTLLGILVLSYTTLYWMRFYEAVSNWDFLSTLLAYPPPIYFVITGLLWGLVGLVICWSLWSGKAWAPKATWIAMTAFTLLYWIDRLAFANHNAWMPRIPFMLAFCLVFYAIALWSLTRKNTKQFFRG